MVGTTKLAVRKESSSIPCGGFHYMLHPLRMGNDVEAAIFDQMGYVIIEVPDPQAATLLDGANAALRHQIDVAGLTESALAAKK